MDTDAVEMAKTLDQWLNRDQAVSELNAYFAEPHEVTSPRHVYSGRFFERLGGGGDRPEVCDRFTGTDLVAVSMLSVDVPPEMTIAILHGELGRTLARLLRHIPTNVALGDDNADPLLADGSPLDEAWRLLKAQPDAGYVIAGKLLARKRPQLVPVYDSVVRCALEEPPALWLPLHQVIADDSSGVRGRLRQLRAQARMPVEVGELRVLDVVLWRGHRRHHNRQGCNAPGTTALEN